MCKRVRRKKIDTNEDAERARDRDSGLLRYSRLGVRESTEFRVDGAPDTEGAQAEGERERERAREREGCWDDGSVRSVESTRARISSVFSVLFRERVLGVGKWGWQRDTDGSSSGTRGLELDVVLRQKF